MVTPHNLPPAVTPFIGRREELAEIAGLLADPDCHLLTLIGPGGIGKTRLALQTAQEHAEAEPARFPDGVYFVALAPLEHANSLLPAVAAAVGFAFSGRDDPAEQLRRYFCARRMLLVLDNVEHLLPEAADFVADLLAAGPGVRVLATSREPFHLQQEWLRTVPGMHFPAQLSTGDDAFPTPYSAIMFFNACARRVSGQFSLAEEYAHVARICQMVEGMPLGIELAAAWLSMMTPAEIADEMQRSLDFLTTRARNIPERHRSIRVVFESSWARLAPEEQDVLAGLALLRGGFDRQAAREVAGASLPVLAGLVAHSLLQTREDGRYTLHELLRQFAEEKLHARPALDEAVQSRLATYYASFLRDHFDALRGPDQIAALDAVEAELDNIRTGWMVAVGQRDVALMRDLLTGMLLFYTMRPRPDEARQMLEGSVRYWVAQPDLTADETLMIALLRVNLAYVLVILHLSEPASDVMQLAAPVLRAAPDDITLAYPCIILGWAYIWLGNNPGEARYWLERALALLEAAGDQWGLAYVTRILGDSYHATTDYAESRRLFTRSVAISRANADPWNINAALQSQGQVAYTMGDYATAEALNREAVALAEAVGARHDLVWGMGMLGQLALVQGRYAEVPALVTRTVAVAEQLGDYNILGDQLHALGLLAGVMGDYDTAWREFARANAMWQRTPSLMGPAWLMSDEGWICVRAGDLDRAETLAAGALERFIQRDHPWGVAATQHVLGEVARLRGDLAGAGDLLLASIREAAACKSVMLVMRHLGSVARWLADRGDPERALALLALVEVHPASWHFVRQEAAESFGAIAADLPDDAVAAARAQGEALSVEAVINTLLADAPLPDGSPGAPRDAGGRILDGPLLLDPLTEREQEVLRLIDAGLTNAEIADELVVGVSTVKKHINHLYSKLDVTTRTQAIVRGRALGLLGNP